VAIFVYLENLVWGQAAFVDRTRRNGEAQWFPGNNSAEISTGTQNPTSSMKIVSKTYQIFGGGSGHDAQL
jgi:hypothetical protein